MTDQRMRFCEEYIIDLNGRAAAERAGYSPHTARSQAGRLLADPDVQDMITRLKAERSARTQVTADRVVEELAVLAFSDIDHYVQTMGQVTLAEGAPKSAKRAIGGVTLRERFDRQGNPIRECEMRLWDKNSAIDKLAKHLGMYAKDGLELPNGLIIRVVQE